MTLLADAALLGPPPADVFHPVPRDDYIASIRDSVDDLIDDIQSDTRNVILTLARMWASVQTHEVYTKDAAAQWVLQRLPGDVRWVLAEARDMYLGKRADWSGDPVNDARSYAEEAIREIKAASQTG